MNTTTYEANERKLFLAQIREVENAPLDKDSAAELADTLATNPELIAQRITWMLDGSYGKGAYDAAHDVANNRRMNRNAWMVQTITALEWNVKSSKVRAIWKKLTPLQQRSINFAVTDAVSGRNREQA